MGGCSDGTLRYCQCAQIDCCRHTSVIYSLYSMVLIATNWLLPVVVTDMQKLHQQRKASSLEDLCRTERSRYVHKIG